MSGVYQGQMRDRRSAAYVASGGGGAGGLLSLSTAKVAGSEEIRFEGWAGELMTKPLLELKNLKKYFPITRGLFGRAVGQVRAVDDVTLNINAGEALGLYLRQADKVIRSRVCA